MGRNMSAARTDGFIRNIHSRNPFDVIRADVVISRLEKQAHWGCGLHYEIYEANLFDMAMNHLSRLPLKDRPVFIGGHCCKVSDEAAFCLIQRPYISKTLLTRRISPRGSP